MIKDCRVVINNEAVTVVRFEDIDIQFPSIHSNSKFVRVLYQEGKYKIVNPDYEENTSLATENGKSKRNNKKTAMEKIDTDAFEEDVTLNAM